MADLDTCPLPPDNRYSVIRLRLEQDFTARLLVNILFTKYNFRKNVYADFYGDLDINFVVTVFDPNS